MKRRAEGAPFQLFIGIVVFGMALVIGAYLFDMVNCWKCNELLKAEVTNLREAISSVGKGDINSRDNILVKIQDLGSCVEGIYIRHVIAGSGISCKSFCPQHPNSCWVIIPDSSCSNEDVEMECIDVSGEMDITPESGFDALAAISSPDPWKDGAYSIPYTLLISIEKTGPSEITLRKP